MTAPAPPRDQPRLIWSWALYDWANSAFALLQTGSGVLGSAAGGFLYQLLGAPLMFLATIYFSTQARKPSQPSGNKSGFSLKCPQVSKGEL